jgi:CO dehydrogenase/acetyl-CoA synthase beta subunit
MGNLDSQILSFLKLLSELGSETEFQKIQIEPQALSPAPSPEPRKKLPSSSGPLVGFVPQSEIWLELGPPTLPSVQLLLSTDDTALVNKNQVTVLGDDLNQLPHGTYPFAQVILVAGSRLTDRQDPAIFSRIAQAYQANGCMYRAAQGRIWLRLRKGSIESGFNFRVLGQAFFQSIYDQVPEVEACEAVFITSDPQTVARIVTFSEGFYRARQEILKERFSKIGQDIYECSNPLDCESCPDGPVCDLIKETVQVIKKRREEFFGKETT